MISDTTPTPRLQPISFFSIGNSGSVWRSLASSLMVGSLILLVLWFQPASGGLTPAKNTQEIASPTQMMKPNRLTT